MDAASATGAAIAGDFELTVAPLRPEAQRFRFEGGIGTTFERTVFRETRQISANPKPWRAREA